MSSLNFSFSDIRIILCVQGYPLNYQYVVREIGFWFNGQSGSIPFNCKINANQLDTGNHCIISKCVEEINGIRLKKTTEAGLSLSETKAVLRTLYHLNDSKAKLIGICGDDNINGLLFKAGLGSYVKDLKFMDIFKQSNTTLPTNEMIRSTIKQKMDNYKVCNMHDRLLVNNEFPLCAKVKAEFIANYCMNFQTRITPTIQYQYEEILDDIQKTTNQTANQIN